MSPQTKASIEREWNKQARLLLEGRKITLARYMSDEEAAACGFMSRPVILQLDNGTVLYPAADDEGNDGGAIHGEAVLHGGITRSIGLPVLR